MPVSSLILRSGAATLACLSFLANPASAATYQLQDNFSGANFFNNFDFFTAADPTNGFVTYVDRATAQSSGLISAADGSPARMGVDFTTQLNSSGPGRASVRITSKKSYTQALIISDIAHMPGGICGTWPAHWTLGPNWPTNGEIDIIEGVNNAATNLMSLHTSPGCTIAGSNETGTLQSNNCDTTINYNEGCGVTANTQASYGAGFNGGLGGVYATEWTADYIRIFFFPRGSIPADITAGQPNPANWGLPQANLQGSCNIGQRFANHQIIFDTTFCGDYGNADWAKNPTCMSLGGPSCAAYVAGNPGAFQNAYWNVNSIQVYQLAGPTTVAPVPTVPLTSAIPQSSVLAPGMGNTTSIAATATTNPFNAATKSSALPGATQPAVVGTFNYLGCASSAGAFSTFTQVANNPSMTLDFCTSQCGAYSFAGIYNTLCFCGNTLPSDLSVSSANTCRNPCPGNLSQFCGGTLRASRLAIRQASGNILLSLYQNSAIAPLVSAVPARQTLGYGMGMPTPSPVVKVTVTTNYIDVCNVCAGGYTTIPYRVTITKCGCVANEVAAYGAMTASPTVPMVAVQTVCSSCGVNGGSATVTVTIPAAIATSPATITLGGLSGGAAANNGVAVVSQGATVAVVNGATATQTGGKVMYTGAASKVAGSMGALVAAAGMAFALL